MSAQPGLRERKKQQTRLAISQVATRLFIERGFDNVTMAEVADAAQVSVNTLFNYFTTKEELFFDRGREVEEEPSRIVRERRPDESIPEALHRCFRAAVEASTGLFMARNIPFVATVDASPALRLQWLVLMNRSEQRLVQTLIDETGAPVGDPTPRVVAALVTGLEWMLIQEFRTRLLRGEPEDQIRAALLHAADQGFAMLSSGVGAYGRRGDPPQNQS